MKHADQTNLDQYYKRTAWSQEHTALGIHCKCLCLELREKLVVMAFQEPTAAQRGNTFPAAGQRYGLLLTHYCCSLTQQLATRTQCL